MFRKYDQQCSNDSLALVFSSRPIKMSPRFVLGRENVPCVAEVVNRSLKADCTDFTPETGNRESVYHQLAWQRGEDTAVAFKKQPYLGL